MQSLLALEHCVDHPELPGLQADQAECHYHFGDCCSEDAGDRKPDLRGKRLRFGHQDCHPGSRVGWRCGYLHPFGLLPCLKSVLDLRYSIGVGV